MTRGRTKRGRTKRRRPWGSITPHRDGFMVRAGDAERTYVGTYETVKLAEAALAEAWEYHQHLHPAAGPGATLIGYGCEWLERQEELGRRRGIDRERARFTRHLAQAPFATWPLTAITQRDVQRWVRALADGEAEGPRARGQKRSRRTVSNILNLLRSILKSAIEEELLDVSPAGGVVVPRTPSKTEDFTYLSADELEALRTTDAVPLKQHSAFLVAAYAGLRPGELWGLRWADVHLGARPEIVVRASRGGATKGGKVRRVPLLEPARAALERWRSGRIAPGPDALVWPSTDGGIYRDGYDGGWVNRPQTPRHGRTYTQLGWAWHAGIRRHVPLKALRHTCACHLLRGTHVARGWIARPLRMEEVQAWLGHASITTTERYYARLAPGGLIDVVRGPSEGPDRTES